MVRVHQRARRRTDDVLGQPAPDRRQGDEEPSKLTHTACCLVAHNAARGLPGTPHQLAALPQERFEGRTGDVVTRDRTTRARAARRLRMDPGSGTDATTR